MPEGDGAGGELVLIVEDNAANLMLAEAVLKRAGYRTQAARSAEQALAWLHANRPDGVLPDVILMDIQLPGQDGLTLTRQLKADATTSRIPVIALTAHAMKDHEHQARAAGCEGFIAKPINTRTFASEVAATIEMSR